MRLPLLSFALLAFAPVTALAALDAKTLRVESVVMSDDYQTATLTLSRDPEGKVHIRSEFYMGEYASPFGGSGWPVEDRVVTLGGFEDDLAHAEPGSTVRMVFRVCPYDEPYTGKHVDEYCGGPTTISVARRASGSFSDVPGDHANAGAIAYVRERGIVEGYADGTYRPDVTINRAEFTKLVIAAIASPEELRKCDAGAMGFSDVDPAAWYAPYLCVGKARGIVTGHLPSSAPPYFAPTEEISFIEAAKIVTVSQGVGEPPLDCLAEYGRACYEAAQRGDIWYRRHVVALEQRGAIPLSVEFLQDRVTRGELAEILYRVMVGVGDRATRTYDELAAKGTW